MDVILRKNQNSPNKTSGTNPPNEVYDLSLAGYLTEENNKLKEFKRDGRQFVWVFEDTPKLREDVLRFYNKEGRVEPSSYSEALRRFKAMLKHSED